MTTPDFPGHFSPDDGDDRAADALAKAAEVERSPVDDLADQLAPHVTFKDPFTLGLLRRGEVTDVNDLIANGNIVIAEEGHDAWENAGGQHVRKAVLGIIAHRRTKEGLQERFSHAALVRTPEEVVMAIVHAPTLQDALALVKDHEPEDLADVLEAVADRAPERFEDMIFLLPGELLVVLGHELPNIDKSALLAKLPISVAIDLLKLACSSQGRKVPLSRIGAAIADGHEHAITIFAGLAGWQLRNLKTTTDGDLEDVATLQVFFAKHEYEFPAAKQKARDAERQAEEAKEAEAAKALPPKKAKLDQAPDIDVTK